MKNKIPKKQEKLREDDSDEESGLKIVQEEAPQLNFMPKMIKKQALFVTFSGVIEAGSFHQYDSLSLFYVITNGPDWTRVSGQKEAMSQIAASNGKKIVWNLPFDISFETTFLAGWPQIIVILYGTDFFGRSLVRGYGNVHFPSTSGIQNRKIRVFQPLPQSALSGFMGYIQGCIAQYKDPEKVLSSGQGRQVTRVKTIGQISLKIQTTKYNFGKYGYQ